MEAIKGNIHLILNGFKQFIIPVYQRTYSWERPQCERLWKDIVKMQKSNRIGHFVGSIVNITEQAMPTGIQKFMIIDGQQRMTTLTLLLIALRDYALTHPEDTSVNAPMITGMCLKNDFQKGDDRYKLLLTHSDKDALIKLIEKAPLDGIKVSRVIDNYDFFVEKIASQELKPQEVYESIGKLQIVNITLDRQYDDPQLIFESLNSTGMDLSQSDLIRNYVLMGLDPNEQNYVYENIWYPMENLFDYEKQTILMDKFFRDYLTMKLGVIPTVNKVYDAFKTMHQNNGPASIRDLSQDVYCFAKYYTNMVFCKSADKVLNSIFNDIKSLQMEVSYPFLLKVYHDYENKLISYDEFVEILRLCESYVFRRAICAIPTNSLNKTFATMKNDIHLDVYLNSVKAYFILRDSYKELPNDDEFGAELKVKDIYNMRTRNYILSKFENFRNKAPINIENYTIEHIMPQNSNLSTEWRADLGEDWKAIQKEYIHTIGNLTLTAYNSEMSDRSFIDKLEMDGGFKQSALRVNSYVVKQATWNRETILERADELCELAKLIWSYPILSESELEPFIPDQKVAAEYSFDDYEYLVGDTKKLYDALDKRIMNISSAVKKEYKKRYIAYKAETNFVDIVPQKYRLRVSMNMKYSKVNDPKGLCLDVTNLGRWGNGDVEVGFENPNQIDDLMDIIMQSYNMQMDD